MEKAPNISSLISSHVIAIYNWLIDSMEYCRDSYEPGNQKEYIDKTNIIEVFDVMHDFVTNVEGDFHDVVNTSYPAVPRSFEEWAKY